MSSKQPSHINPTRHLPKPMRQYLGLPTKLFVLWLLLSGLAFAMYFWNLSNKSPDIAQSTAEAGIEPMPPTATPPVTAMQNLTETQAVSKSITVSGLPDFNLQKTSEKVLISTPGAPAMVLIADADEPRVQTQAGQLIYRLKTKDDGQSKIYDASGTYRYRLKCETEEGEDTCKLYDDQGAVINRVKVKADSFNVYADGSQRLYKGKFKNGAYVLKTEAGDKTASIQGVDSLKEAALLSMPVEIPLRVLLWHQGSR